MTPATIFTEHVFIEIDGKVVQRMKRIQKIKVLPDGKGALADGTPVERRGELWVRVVQ